METARPDIAVIKGRLGSLAPGKLAALSAQYPVVASLLIDCKHLVAYVEEIDPPRKEAP